ncbi:hypothetical protein SPRG_04236 [Saprolegnia parasitica CBS 223.65]|uniref:Uncharacterized protein n=1 Tax=Saprolegnia parasitica (strain CBS 223.65) TaxID=695850 RepID=A0A067CWC9_SAPPC|nr:hypothetical protein SPRG_04236 [Saprolegnia parasitica CBS 223.65]KDO31097.1 hypothetical protein SPRG_04236 [Saprolegnia parasitica CBS 223.65]|eukprot:XP_012198226.1 hypothetical protein SPRG_04236 [Saprolegnia parasitica CBS 223.65]
MQAIFEPFTGPVLSYWCGVAAWKRSFLDAAAARGLREYYTIRDFADPTIDEFITVARRAEILAAAEIAVAPVPQDLPWAEFGEVLLARTRAVLAHAAGVMETEAAAHQARTVAAAVAFLLSALSPHLHGKLGMCRSPYELWASVHAKGFELMDDCRFFGLLENVRFADNDERPDGLARVEEHIQRFVDVIFVPSHGLDARLVAAADRLKMALLCNACPPATVGTFEAWRADEPVWNYASMRRRLVEYWAPNRPLAGDALAPTVVADAPAAPLEPAPETVTVEAQPMPLAAVMDARPADAPAANMAPDSATAIDTLVDGKGASHRSHMVASVDLATDGATSSTEKGRPAKRSTDASVTDVPGNQQHDYKRRRQTPVASPGAVARLQQDSVATRVSPRQHLGALRALRTASVASSPGRSSTAAAPSVVPFTEDEVEFLRAAQRCATDSAPTIFERGRAQGLFLNRSVSSIQPFTEPVLADWGGVAAWKRGFFDATATRGLRELYFVQQADPNPTRTLQSSWM